MFMSFIVLVYLMLYIKILDYMIKKLKFIFSNFLNNFNV